MPQTLIIPFHRLPSGFVRSLGPSPVNPVSPRAAATVALLRHGPGGLEVLLLRRGERTRFLPGAFVFPGGRVEEDDGSEEVLALVDGLGRHEADRLLGRSGTGPEGLAFCVAALRETFEETGIILGPGKDGGRSVPVVGGTPDVRLRLDLHHGLKRLSQVLGALGARLEAGRLRYVAHWVTPVHEPYRYDTRFFAAEVPAHLPVSTDGVELVESLWLSPEEALRRNRAGTLPMVFPTLLTLEALTAYSDPGEALRGMGEGEIPRFLPTLEETEDGVRMTL